MVWRRNIGVRLRVGSSGMFEFFYLGLVDRIWGVMGFTCVGKGAVVMDLLEV